eukprot:CAMPEP_0170528416 /NCGR_PEP_ID=MMETSP0209-20121228/13923_1 /TAXON_ID=665100 ORGANISM="Litonotus pictus, Strain P1" /NCGR_SAMPLE_ID=MMETSP0209 /ASSEMBLY_ACC=CAM_ASM_000301 /LENGTH=166 /DNA_ID=CAMNT_0010819615 /DNA_START=709 /DNA_END=1205 /DNA_ORIENTATION=+
MNHFFKVAEISRDEMINDFFPNIVDNIKMVIFYITNSAHDSENEAEVLKENLNGMIEEFILFEKMVASFRAENDEDIETLDSLLNYVLEIIEAVKKNEVGLDLQSIFSHLSHPLQELIKIIYFNLLDYNYFKKVSLYYHECSQSEINEHYFPFENCEIGKKIIKIL